MAVHAVSAAVKLICKDRYDSFTADSSFQSFVWDDEQHCEEGVLIFEPPSKELSRNLHNASRPKTGSNKAKKGSRSKDTIYGDENRPMDANVDRKEAMKMASKPALAAVAESPRLSDLASARFRRGNSVQQSPRQCGSFSTGYGSFTEPRSVDMRSPRNRDAKVGFPSPPGTPGVPRPPSFSLGDPIGPSSPRAGKTAVRAVARSPPRHGSGDWPPTDPCVVYQPRSNCPSYTPSYVPSDRPSYEPPVLQARQMSRCASADTHVRGTPFGNRPVCKATPSASASPRGSSMTSLFASATPQPGNATPCASPRGSSSMVSLFNDKELLRRKLVVPPGNQLVRNPSHDAPVCDESIQSLRRSKRDGTSTPEPGLITPRMSTYPLLLGDKIAHLDPVILGERTKRAAERKMATRSRSASVFWQPPPEAVAICEIVRSPSFLLHAKAEAPAATALAREATDELDGSGGRWGPPQKLVGSSSSKAVVTAVCSTLSNSFVPPSPSMRPRESYMATRNRSRHYMI